MTILSDCPCYGATLDKLVQPAILAALIEGPIHGYGLAERINKTAGTCESKADLSGIYRFLKKMEATGLVVSAWEAGGKGHAKRLYKITPDGLTCLARWTLTLESYVESINKLLDEAKAALAHRPKLHKISAKRIVTPHA